MNIVNINFPARMAQTPIDGVLYDVEIPAMSADARVIRPSRKRPSFGRGAEWMLGIGAAGAACGYLLMAVLS